MPVFREIHSATSSIMKLCAVATLFILLVPGEQVSKLENSLFHTTQLKQNMLFYSLPTCYYIVLQFYITFLLPFLFQASAYEQCMCTLINTEKTFPFGELNKIEDNVSKCIRDVTPQKVLLLLS